MYQDLTIVGNLGGDPELRYLQDGSAVANFSVATNRKWNDAGGNQKDETTWFRVSVFGRQAEVCNQYLSKGRQVLVKGRLRPDPQTGGPRVYQRQDGTSGSSFDVSATLVRFLAQSGGSVDDPGHGASEDTEIPF